MVKSIDVLQVLKPTPTALPPATALFDIPSSYSIWASTDYAVQSWNLQGSRITIIQAIILLVLVAVGLILLTKFIKDITQKDSQD